MLCRWLRHSDNQDQNTDYEGESDTSTNFNTSDTEESPKSHNSQRSKAAQLSQNPCKLAWGTAANFTTSETESGKSPSSQNSHQQRRKEAAAHLSLHPCKLAWGGGQRSNYLTTTTLV